MTSQTIAAKMAAEDAAYTRRRAGELAAELRAKEGSPEGIDHFWLCFWAGQVSYVLGEVADVEAISEASK